MSVDFATKCYENDWQIVLGKDYLRVVVERSAHTFSRRWLIINNVKARGPVEAAAKAAVARGDLDEYLFAEDCADAALKFLQIDKASFGRGYFYSIGELVAIHASTADYLLYYTGDAYPKRRFRWIEPAIQLMESRSDFIVANLSWNDRFEKARSESFGQDGDFLVGYGFSDQCFLAKMSVFRAPIYNEPHPTPERFPAYPAAPFEQRVDAYMRNHGAKRLTHRFQSYTHKNIPKGGLMRVWRRLRPLA
ncbi:MAG: hypothetical protein ABJB10_19295 [Mesorhizobium sp.]